MPISGPSSYVTTVPLFEAHWIACNSALPAPSPLKLPGELLDRVPPVVVADLTGQFADLGDVRVLLDEKILDLDLMRADRDLGETAAIERLVQFNDFVRLYLAKTKWARVLPAAPSVGDAASKITGPLDRVAALWLKLNGGAAPGLTIPVVLQGNFTQADFATMVGDLKLLFTELGVLEVQTDLQREERNDIQDVIYEILKAYRLAVPTRFAADSAQVESMPLLTPLPGSTPEPVMASGVWDAVASQGKIGWTLSEEVLLEKYEVRYSPGLVYHADDESVVGTVLPGEPLELLTLTGLTLSGAKALFRVYVILTTGNEAGSNDVQITRP